MCRAPLLTLLVSLLALHSTCFGEDDIPLHTFGDESVSTNTTYINKDISVSAPESKAPPAGPSYSTFNVARSNFVPDLTGAVNSSNVVTMINRVFQVHTKSGTAVTNTSLRAFWEQGGTTGTIIDVFDPVIVFDPEAKRFIATAAHDPRQANSGLLIGVSLSEDPTGNWNLRRFSADSAQLSWGDQPHIGFNANHIVVSATLLQNTNGNGGATGSRIYVFDKTNLYAGNYSAPSIFTVANRTSFRPAPNYDAGSTNLMLLAHVSGNSGAGGVIGWARIGGTPSSPVFSHDPTVLYRVDGRTWASQASTLNFGPQASVSDKFFMSDPRMQSVHQKNGKTWGVHMIYTPAATPTRTILQFFQVHEEAEQQPIVGTIDDGSSFFGYPSISVNAFGDILSLTQSSDLTFTRALHLR